MKNRISSLALFFLLTAASLQAQYQFTMVSDCHCTSIKNQQNTGTCWSFATSSFLESELLKMGKEDHDISEMFFVRQIYLDKSENYLLRQGKAQLGQGGLAHDVISAFVEAGAMPEAVYSGKLSDGQMHDHSEMETALIGMMGSLVKQKKIGERWPDAVKGILDAYMGKAPEKFKHNGKEYTPKSYAASLGINPDDYVSFTSYTHHPFYEQFVLEIPDNWANGSFYNVPIDDLVAITKNAIEKGYSVAWDGDVSEKGFSASKGVAVLPVDEKSEMFAGPVKELEASQELRQSSFFDYTTTDDHLMHLTGLAKDQNGTPYYYIKNSWGEISPYQGYVYMSEPYFRVKTVGILVNKNAVPDSIWKKLGVSR